MVDMLGSLFFGFILGLGIGYLGIGIALFVTSYWGN